MMSIIIKQFIVIWRSQRIVSLFLLGKKGHCLIFIARLNDGREG